MWLEEDINEFEAQYEKQYEKIFERENAALNSICKMFDLLKETDTFYQLGITEDEAKVFYDRRNNV